MTAGVCVQEVTARACKIPTDRPEADGTLSWKDTTIVIATARAGDAVGIGYSYTDAAAVQVVCGKLAETVEGCDALSPPLAWERMREAVRNIGYPGVVSSAVSAVDVALWDLKARLLDMPLARLLGQVREQVPIYGSGGFTSYSDEQLQEQLAGWVAQGIPRVKMKVGSEPERDPQRVRIAREAIGPDAQLFVDANGAYSRKQALALAHVFSEQGVSWFEEPVSSDDLEGLRLLRDRAPAGMDIAAGEYGYELFYFRRMLQAGAVDVLQADVTRCGGITTLMKIAALCESWPIQLSAHTAPSIHAHACAAIVPFAHIEYFHDHARIEGMLFEGTLSPREGTLQPAHDRPGLGLGLREDAIAAHLLRPPPQAEAQQTKLPTHG